MGIKSKDTVNFTVAAGKFNAQQDDTPVRAMDLAAAMTERFDENVWKCVARGKKDREGNFFVVVLTRREAIARRIVRSQFLHRLTCPTPNYEQIVFKYHRLDDRLEEIWVISSREVCMELKNNILESSKDALELLKYVLDFADGTLDEVMRVLNHEKKYSLELEDK